MDDCHVPGRRCQPFFVSFHGGGDVFWVSFPSTGQPTETRVGGSGVCVCVLLLLWDLVDVGFRFPLFFSGVDRASGCVLSGYLWFG